MFEHLLQDRVVTMRLVLSFKLLRIIGSSDQWQRVVQICPLNILANKTTNHVLRDLNIFFPGFGFDWGTKFLQPYCILVFTSISVYIYRILYIYKYVLSTIVYTFILPTPSKKILTVRRYTNEYVWISFENSVFC